MPKRNKTIEEELQIIQYLLAGILLKKEPNIKEVAKIMEFSDKTITKFYPERKKKKK